MVWHPACTTNKMFYWHDGVEDFPHCAGASAPGWYVYTFHALAWHEEDFNSFGMFHAEPSGPFATIEEARA